MHSWPIVQRIQDVQYLRVPLMMNFSVRGRDEVSLLVFRYHNPRSYRIRWWYGQKTIGEAFQDGGQDPILVQMMLRDSLPNQLPSYPR